MSKDTFFFFSLVFISISRDCSAVISYEHNKCSDGLEYIVWKNDTIDKWKEIGFGSHVSQMKDLLWFLEEDVLLLSENPGDEDLQQDVLYGYNFLRELLEKSQAKSLNEIDYQWLKITAQHDIVKYEIMELYDAEKPVFAKEWLVKEALQIIDPPSPVVVLSCKDEKLDVFDDQEVEAYCIVSHNTAFVSVCHVPDLDRALFVVYHELGHVVNRDIYFSEGGCPEHMLNNPDHHTDIRAIDRYMTLGKKAFDRNSRLGRRINDILTKYPEDLLFWNPPEKDYHKALCIRSNELRADLFAARTLFYLGKLSVFLLAIDYYSDDYPIAWQNFVKSLYPNQFERAMYLAGFLVEQGVDINAAIQKWEHRGKCIEFEKVTPLTKRNYESLQCWRIGHNIV